MIYSKRHGKNERRALNIIWTASGDYQYEPDFMSFGADGKPDFYLNSIIGFVHKWYKGELLRTLFLSFDNSILRDTFTDLLWLALENCTFEKEYAVRPVLAPLRKIHAKQFLDHEIDLHIAELMYRSSVVYDLHTERWCGVLGKRKPLLDPWEERLSRALTYDASMTTEEIIERTKRTFKTFFVFKLNIRPENLKVFHLSVNGVLLSVLKLLFPSWFTGTEGTDSPMRTPLHGQRRTGGGSSSLLSGFFPDTLQKDASYITAVYGKPLFGPQKTARIENEICTGNHRECHFSVCRSGSGTSASAVTLQRERNKSYYRRNRQQFSAGISRLSQIILNSLSSVSQPVAVRSASGVLRPPVVWRSLILYDNAVFSGREDSVLPDFTVDLMLDASNSRSSEQEVIAAQSYIIAESLTRCHIPVQVYSFCTERGFTVLSVFRTYREPERNSALFDYHAGGWNRDGLALRGASALMSRNDTKKRILLILTDASPNDDRPLPPVDHRPFRYDYSGEKAEQDTASVVKELTDNNIKVIAVVNGAPAGHDESASRIYGKNFVRIESLDQFAPSVGKLLTEQIRTLTQF